MSQLMHNKVLRTTSFKLLFGGGTEETGVIRRLKALSSYRVTVSHVKPFGKLLCYTRGFLLARRSTESSLEVEASSREG